MTTPSPAERGCQLSLRFVHVDQVEKVNSLLKEKGIICDVRKPNIMRVAPAPLYNSFSDVFKFVTTLKEILGLDLCRRPSS